MSDGIRALNHRGIKFFPPDCGYLWGGVADPAASVRRSYSEAGSATSPHNQQPTAARGDAGPPAWPSRESPNSRGRRVDAGRVGRDFRSRYGKGAPKAGVQFGGSSNSQRVSGRWTGCRSIQKLR